MQSESLLRSLNNVSVTTGQNICVTLCFGGRALIPLDATKESALEDDIHCFFSTVKCM